MVLWKEMGGKCGSCDMAIWNVCKVSRMLGMTAMRVGSGSCGYARLASEDWRRYSLYFNGIRKSAFLPPQGEKGRLTYPPFVVAEARASGQGEYHGSSPYLAFNA